MIEANNPTLVSWLPVPEKSDFPIQNLPFGIFKTDSLSPRVGVRIGDHVVDLKSLFVLGYLENLPFELSDFDVDVLNPLMKKGKDGVRLLRNRLSKLLSSGQRDLQQNAHHVEQVILPIDQVTMCMPVQIGDYTYFYS